MPGSTILCVLGASFSFSDGIESGLTGCVGDGGVTSLCIAAKTFRVVMHEEMDESWDFKPLEGTVRRRHREIM